MRIAVPSRPSTCSATLSRDQTRETQDQTRPARERPIQSDIPTHKWYGICSNVLQLLLCCLTLRGNRMQCKCICATDERLHIRTIYMTSSKPSQRMPVPLAANSCILGRDSSVPATGTAKKHLSVVLPLMRRRLGLSICSVDNCLMRRKAAALLPKTPLNGLSITTSLAGSPSGRPTLA